MLPLELGDYVVAVSTYGSTIDDAVAGTYVNDDGGDYQLAIDLPRDVLPVPGGPISKTPFGILPPSFWNF